MTLEPLKEARDILRCLDRSVPLDYQHHEKSIEGQLSILLVIFFQQLEVPLFLRELRTEVLQRMWCLIVDTNDEADPSLRRSLRWLFKVPINDDEQCRLDPHGSELNAYMTACGPSSNNPVNMAGAGWIQWAASLGERDQRENFFSQFSPSRKKSIKKMKDWFTDWAVTPDNVASLACELAHRHNVAKWPPSVQSSGKAFTSLRACSIDLHSFWVLFERLCKRWG